MNKYGAEKVEHHGRSFHSKLEKAVYEYLLAREEAGEIKDIECQVHVRLTEARVLYIPDFMATDTATGKKIYIEAKGYEGPRWPTIKKLWRVYGYGNLEIYKGSYKNPILDEIIVPKGEKDA